MAIDEETGWVPDSCSLPTVEQPLRVAEFDRLFRESVMRSIRLDATRLELLLAADAVTSAQSLAQREVGCCSFFRFDFDVRGPDVVMQISVPPSRTEVLDALTVRVSASLAAGRR